MVDTELLWKASRLLELWREFASKSKRVVLEVQGYFGS